MVAFSSHFTRTTNAFCCFSGFFFRRFFIISAQFHFTEAAFSLHFLFQNTQSLFDIIVMNNDSNYSTHTPFGLSDGLFVRAFYHKMIVNASTFFILNLFICVWGHIEKLVFLKYSLIFEHFLDQLHE